ncbi:MAG: NAD-dependent epimerase/dehydratase family protein [Deltaproteobacteria bacterium]|nr:NAD-dependent epimerase/dehydratase family protein [Deltaproteobacteria bacterium]
MSKILITGAAGFIGYHLASSLVRQGHSLTLVDNLKRGQRDQDFESLLNQPKIKFLALDLTEKESFKKLEGEYDFIYHLAAINGTKNFYTIPDQVIKVNVLSTLYLLDWMRKNSKAKILYSSSSETYAGTTELVEGLIPSREDIPLCIEDITNVRWSYGASKLLAESALFSFARVQPLRFSIVRYHNIYGPRMGFDHVLPQFFERIFKGELPLKVFGGQETRSFCYVSDAVAATERVMMSESANGQIVHIGNSDELKIRDLAKLVLEICNKPTDIIIEKAPEGSVKRRCPNTEKLKKLGHQSIVTLKEGLEEMRLWYQKRFIEGQAA